MIWGGDFDPKQPAVVPDGVLSLGGERFIGEQGRLSYVLWEEDNIVPTLALEVVSKTYGGEYERQRKRYADLGIRDYASTCQIRAVGVSDCP